MSLWVGFFVFVCFLFRFVLFHSVQAPTDVDFKQVFLHLAVTSVLYASIWAVVSGDGLVQPEQATCCSWVRLPVVSAADRAV